MNILVVGVKNRKFWSILGHYTREEENYKICIVSGRNAKNILINQYDIIFVEKKYKETLICKNARCIVVDNNARYELKRVKIFLKQFLEERIYSSSNKCKERCLKNNKIYENIKKIMYVESERNRVHFVIENMVDKFTEYCKLDEVERQFLGYGFVRIHKSYLVNISFIKKIKWSEVILKNGKTLPVPKNRYKEVKDNILEILRTS